jgi:hypothetical protein
VQMTIPGRRAVFDKTNGHCHFCGDKLVFEHYELGEWELDHVIQKKKGGTNSPENYLPACGKCNHLRWHRSGKDLRDVIFLGLIANDEVTRKSELGKRLKELRDKRLERNETRPRKARKNRSSG